MVWIFEGFIHIYVRNQSVFYSKDKKSLNQISSSETSSVGDARRARLASLDAKMTPPKVRTTRVLIGCF